LQAAGFDVVDAVVFVGVVISMEVLAKHQLMDKSLEYTVKT